MSWNKNMSRAIAQYKSFKKMYIVDKYTAEFTGLKTNYFLVKLIFFDEEFDSDLNLRFVRIYFYATTFDRITKDKAAKFVDMLSAIGGTMGLLTGFSIISGVEIFYFVVKIMIKIIKLKGKKRPMAN